jgi:hypothetical protein
MGIPIHYHVMVDFRAFKEAVNTVGGVDLNVGQNGAVYEQLWDESTGKNYILNVQPGQQHFDGTRALFYARSRYTSPRGDFDRTERQRKIILALKSKVLSAGTYADPRRIAALLNEFGNHVNTNFNGTDDLMRLYDITKDINGSSLVSVGLADPPNSYVTTDNVDGQSIVRPRLGLTDFSEIQKYVRNTLRDGFLAKENAKIMILNGTNIPGLATKKADELRSYGYKVSKVGDAPTHNYSQTTLVDMRNGVNKYTQHYLEQRLGVTTTTKLPDSNINPGTADFIIILGSGTTTQ